MFTTLINHLLAKLTSGNYLWALILLASPILLPWILTGSRLSYTYWYKMLPVATNSSVDSSGQGADVNTRYLQGWQGLRRAQQRLSGHFSQIVRAGPVEGARCQELVLLPAVISTGEARYGQQACSGW